MKTMRSFMRLRRAGLKGANIQDKLLAYRENKDSYKKRSFRHRWNEAKCRYRNFKALGILFPKGWIYVFTANCSMRDSILVIGMV